ncbi:MAG: hypothetical protein H0W88_01730 [Parachlamydiaceae bacterium]|nr:hypothetical protein [Parachlamydiaceae bacterium]
MHIESVPKDSIHIETQVNIDHIGTYAGLLALTELSCGSIIHSLHLPFSGYLLSLNQIFILTIASRENTSFSFRYNSMMISGVATVLKSLAPIGKKLTPMLAISMQGLLFNVGILIFGNSSLGRLLGACLSSFWGFIQPLFLYYLIFGKSLYEAIVGIVKDIGTYLLLEENTIYFIFLGFVILKMILAITIVILTPYLSTKWMTTFNNKTKTSFILKKEEETKIISPLRGAFKDICKPVFLILVMGTTLFFFLLQKDYTAIVWNLLRPLAIGFITFYFIRWIPMERLIGWLEKKQKNAFSSSLKVALNKIRNIFQG